MLPSLADWISDLKRTSGKVGDGQHVHDAPGVVGGVAVQLAPDRLAHGAARAVAADHVAGLDRLDLSLVRGIEPLEPRGHLMRIGIVAGAPVDLKIEQAPRIIRLEPARRFAHDVEVEIMHARLVQNDMRKFRQPVLDVLHPAAADDVLGLLVVRLPERRLVDPAGFLQHALAEAKGLEHLHRAAGDAVGLAEQQRARLLLDDAGLDVGKRGQLRRQRQPGRPAADDQDIDFGRNRAGHARWRNPLGGSAISGSPGSNPFRWNCMGYASCRPEKVGRISDSVIRRQTGSP